MKVLLGQWGLEVSRINPSCKKAHFYPSEESIIKDAPGFSEGPRSLITPLSASTQKLEQ